MGGCYRSSRMDVATWTVLGLLAATFVGGFYYLGSRIDALGTRLDGRIDALEGRIDALGARLDGRIDSQEARIDSVGSRLDALSQNVADLTAAVRALTARFETHLERHAG